MAGRLELAETLGEGGMATVFRARDQSLRRDVAVKVLFPHLAKRSEVVSRFHREARAAAALDHPNILRVIDVGGGPQSVGPDGLCDPPFLVLELIEGNSLDETVRDGGALLAESAAAVGVLACRALGRAHAAGIIHRDIKPANLMLADDGRLVIADFGVAHVAEEDSVVTRTGALLGTPAFMSPEQASAEPLDPRSDLYSLGATLYRLSTATMPFTGPTAKVVTSILMGDLTPVLRRNLAVGPDLATVIMKLMATSADDRYPDAAAVETILTQIVVDSGLTIEQALANISDRDETVLAAVVERTIDRAELCADQGRVPTALGLVDRALALAPKNARAERILEAISSRRSPMRWLFGGAVVLVAAAAVAFFAVPEWFGRGGGEPNGVVSSVSSTDLEAPELLATVSPQETETETGLEAAPKTASETPTPTPTPASSSATKDQKREAALVAQRAKQASLDSKARNPNGTAKATTKDGSDRRSGDEPTGDITQPTTTAAGSETTQTDSSTNGSGTPETAAPPDPKTDSNPAKPVMGSLAIVTSNWCELAIDGKSMGTVHKKKTISIAAGPHRIVCSQSSTGMREIRNVVVTAAKTTPVSFVRKVRVTIGIGDGATVGTKFYARGSSFRTTPRRIGLTIKEGNRSKKVHVDVSGDCVVKGNPVRCVTSR